MDCKKSKNIEYIYTYTPIHQTTWDRGLKQQGCRLLGTKIRKLTRRTPIPWRLVSDTLNTSMTECIMGDNIARRGLASRSSTFAGGFARRAIDGKLAPKPKVDPRVDAATWADNTCILTNNPEPWWQLDLTEPIAVLAVAIVSRKDGRGDSLSRAVVSLSPHG